MILPFPGKIRYCGANGCSIVLTSEQEDWLRRYYPTELNKQLAFIMGIHRASLSRMAKKLGLTKAPAYYVMKNKRQSKHKKNMIHSERLREKWCLPRQTKYHLPMKPYTPKEIMRRRKATERGYITGDVTGGDRYKLFYDEHTQRKSAFERNCVEAGFHIEQY